MPEDHRAHRMPPATATRRSGSGQRTPSPSLPAIATPSSATPPPSSRRWCAANARHAHAELADTPMIDKGCYVMLGNDDLLLRLLAEDAPSRRRSTTTSPG